MYVKVLTLSEVVKPVHVNATLCKLAKHMSYSSWTLLHWGKGGSAFPLIPQPCSERPCQFFWTEAFLRFDNLACRDCLFVSLIDPGLYIEIRGPSKRYDSISEALKTIIGASTKMCAWIVLFVAEIVFIGYMPDQLIRTALNKTLRSLFCLLQALVVATLTFRTFFFWDGK
jgi:hypothetical protein